MAIWIEVQYEKYKEATNARFERVKANEESLNRIFIDMYGLENEITSTVPEKNITMRYIVDSREEMPTDFGSGQYVQTKKDVIVSLISYAVGCMFGRYAPDRDGLIYAGGDWDPTVYTVFPVDEDNIIPVCDGDYFEDDILKQFIHFIRIVYGEESLEDNLAFIADALGGVGIPREILRQYFIRDFFKDHCAVYAVAGSGKRPIYWLFDSGRANAFKCLIYCHRYAPDTIERIRRMYVDKLQECYDHSIAKLERKIHAVDPREGKQAEKKLKRITEQATELRRYSKEISAFSDNTVELDMNDGVQINYAKLQTLLAKIK